MGSARCFFITGPYPSYFRPGADDAARGPFILGRPPRGSHVNPFRSSRESGIHAGASGAGGLAPGGDESSSPPGCPEDLGDFAIRPIVRRQLIDVVTHARAHLPARECHPNLPPVTIVAATELRFLQPSRPPCASRMRASNCFMWRARTDGQRSPFGPASGDAVPRGSRR